MRAVASREVLDYLERERAYYDATVAPLAPARDQVLATATGRIPQVELGVTVERERFGYYTRREQGQENGEIRRFPRALPASRRGEPASDDEVILDIDALAGGSPYVDLGVREVSPDEDLLAYSVDVTGDEVYELRFRDLRTGGDLPDRVTRTYYTGAWSRAGDVFFYTVHDEAYRPYQVRRHVLGTDAETDVVVFTEPDEQYEVELKSCRSGRLIVIRSLSRDTVEEWLLDPHEPEAPPRLVEARSKGREYAVEHAPYGGDDRLVIVTNDEAPEFRLMTAPTATPGREHWRPLMPYDDSERLNEVEAFEDFLVLTLRRSGLPMLRVVRPDGATIREVHAPPAGHVELGESPRWSTTCITVSRQSFTMPAVWHDVDVDSGEESMRHRDEVPGYDPNAYASKRITLPARDGVEIPVTLVHWADVALDGTAPCLMYGYGAYEAVFETEFDVALTALLDQGVVYAFAHVRGGGEGGRRWWLDGRLEAKQHTFSDHIDVADGLAGRYVDGRRIATRGLSAGGLLQAAVFSQRPDRWRAVVAEVPFVDVVTTMLDPSIPLTAGEWDEWGDPRREADFGWMLAYSPYDNLPPAEGRPDLLVTGALHDPRVMVWEPAKWVAALRSSDPDWSPRCLFRVDTGAGAHSGPSGRLARVAYEAEIYAWVLHHLVA
jgi:oligopeptidase B